MTIQRHQSGIDNRSRESDPFLANVVNAGEGLNDEEFAALREWGDSLYDRVGMNPDVSSGAVGHKLDQNTGVSSDSLNLNNYPGLAGEVASLTDPFDAGTRQVNRQIGETVQEVKAAVNGSGSEITDTSELETDVTVRLFSEGVRGQLMNEVAPMGGGVSYEDKWQTRRASVAKHFVEELINGNADVIKNLPPDAASRVLDMTYNLSQKYGSVEHMSDEALAPLGRYLEGVQAGQVDSEDEPGEPEPVGDGSLESIRASVAQSYNQDDFTKAA